MNVAFSFMYHIMFASLYHRLHLYHMSWRCASLICFAHCRMDLPGPTTSVGTRTDYSVGPWDYSACATQHLMAWGARTTVDKYLDRKLYMSCTM
jgi:hypothetical protein